MGAHYSGVVVGGSREQEAEPQGGNRAVVCCFVCSHLQQSMFSMIALLA